MNQNINGIIKHAIGLLESFGYTVISPETYCTDKTAILIALNQTFEGNRRDLYMTKDERWFITYGKQVGIDDVGQIHGEIVKQLIDTELIEPTYPDSKTPYRCYKKRANQ